MPRYYADTYALIEILRGNPAYEKYAEEELITSEFNLLELAYALVRDYGVDRALVVLSIVRATVDIVTPTNEDYVEAAALRIKLGAGGEKPIYHRCFRLCSSQKA
ncbi:PIN domain-containing protein [Infirmifilum sp. SLHALR2]